jgi:hypothetical protein
MNNGGIGPDTVCFKEEKPVTKVKTKKKKKKKNSKKPPRNHDNTPFLVRTECSDTP